MSGTAGQTFAPTTSSQASSCASALGRNCVVNALYVIRFHQVFSFHWTCPLLSADPLERYMEQTRALSTDLQPWVLNRYDSMKWYWHDATSPPTRAQALWPHLLFQHTCRPTLELESSTKQIRLGLWDCIFCKTSVSGFGNFILLLVLNYLTICDTRCKGAIATYY